MDGRQLDDDVTETCRKVRLKELHYDSDSDIEPESDSEQDGGDAYNPRFYKRKGTTPPDDRDHDVDAYCNLLQSWTDNYTLPRPPRDNLTGEERKAFNELREL